MVIIIQAYYRGVTMVSNKDQDNFLYPHYHYRGKVKPENLVFNSNLQEFAQKVGYICSLQTGGKVTPEQAYKKIERLWTELQRSKEELGIG